MGLAEFSLPSQGPARSQSGKSRRTRLSADVATFEILLALIVACVALALLSRRLDMPPAVALILGGMVLAFMPGLPAVDLDPELALSLFLPPLLQISAYRTDWTAFRSNLRPIILLAVGAVFFTAIVVAVGVKFLVPDMPWWAAVALGAIVAPPDAVAAGAVLKEMRLPKRIVTVLEGESLINDASSLVLYRFAVSATLAGTFSVSEGVLQFFATALGGAIIGLLIGRAAMWVFTHLHDTLLDITVSLLAGYVAYLTAEAFEVSGVLAAVGCGLLLGRHQHAEFTARTRLDAAAVWSFVEFILTALVFVLIGLQLRGIVERLGNYETSRLILLGVVVAAVVVLSRVVWVAIPALLRPAFKLGSRDLEQSEPWRHTAIVAWAGMRGVVSLAAALALPNQFPARDLIVFLAFCAIFATLVLQGTTLGWLIRRLRVEEVQCSVAEPEAAQARVNITEAALEAVKEVVEQEPMVGQGDAASEVVSEYEARVEQATIESEDPVARAEQLVTQQRLRLVAIDAARDKLREQADTIEAEKYRALCEELDLEEQKIRRTLGESR
jgi:Na+/H+ antiporter